MQTKNREGDRPPFRAPSIRALARIFGGLHKRRVATRGRLGRPDFSIAGGVRGTPSAPHKLRQLRRAKFRPVQRASAIVTDQRRRRRSGFVSACRVRIERDPKETQRRAKALFTRQDCFILLRAIITLASVLNLRSNAAKAVNVRVLDAYPGSSCRKTAWF